MHYARHKGAPETCPPLARAIFEPSKDLRISVFRAPESLMEGAGRWVSSARSMPSNCQFQSSLGPNTTDCHHRRRSRARAPSSWELERSWLWSRVALAELRLTKSRALGRGEQSLSESVGWWLVRRSRFAPSSSWYAPR